MAWQRVQSPEELHEFLLRDSPEFALVPDVHPRPDEAILDKTTMSAFEGTPLAAAMRALGLTTFAIVGVALEVGIEPTVRHATDLGVVPVVVSDACGGLDRPAMDRALAGSAFEGSTDLLLCTQSVALHGPGGHGRQKFHSGGWRRQAGRVGSRNFCRCP